MNIQDIFYHGIREQVRRVVSQMTDAQIERGLDAFDTGASTWSHCFFARALPTLELDESRTGRPEHKLMKHFGLKNPVPLRVIYCTFDGAGKIISRDQLRDFIREIHLGEPSAAMDEVLRKIDYAGAEDKAIEVCGNSGMQDF